MIKYRTQSENKNKAAGAPSALNAGLDARKVGYSREFDAYYKADTGEWLEDKCSDETCYVCKTRPATANAKLTIPPTTTSATEENQVFVLNDRYGDSIIGNNHDRYDAIEIHGVRDHNSPGDPNGTCCEVDNENPQFFSVYVHLKEGGIECVGDFSTHDLAVLYANELAEKYHWPVNDFAPKLNY